MADTPFAATAAPAETTATFGLETDVTHLLFLSRSGSHELHSNNFGVQLSGAVLALTARDQEPKKPDGHSETAVHLVEVILARFKSGFSDTKPDYVRLLKELDQVLPVAFQHKGPLDVGRQRFPSALQFMTDLVHREIGVGGKHVNAFQMRENLAWNFLSLIDKHSGQPPIARLFLDPKAPREILPEDRGSALKKGKEAKAMRPANKRTNGSSSAEHKPEP